MNLQQIANDIAAYIDTNPEPGYSPLNSCEYVTEAGSKCFIGAIIPDPKTCNKSGSVVGNPAAMSQLKEKYGEHHHEQTENNFLCRVQNLHDVGAAQVYNERPGPKRDNLKKLWLEGAKTQLHRICLQFNLTPPL